MKQHLLFVCMGGRDRSQLAVEIINSEYSDKYEAKCCGIHPMALTKISSEAVKWADILVFMEEIHKQVTLQNFPEAKNKKHFVFNISPEYNKQDPELRKILLEKLKEVI